MTTDAAQQVVPPTIHPLRSHDPLQCGQWRLIGRIGAGGMGTVYLGDHEDQQAAVKVMSDALSDQPGFRDRFAREIRILQRIDGPFVAAVLGGEAFIERPWLATEYVPGPDLAAFVRDHGPMNTDGWTALAVGLLSALARIHAAGIVHRDVKPANILLGPDGPTVIDFGVAQLLDSTALTSTGTALGTPGWLAPEQIRGLPATPATDAFAAGAVLAYAATACPPFGADTTPAAALHSVLNHTPNLIGVTTTQRALLDGLLDKNPETRWSPPRALTLLTGSHDPTVAFEQATRIWQHADATQIHNPAPAGSRDTGTAPATQRPGARRTKIWWRIAITATAAPLLAGSALLGTALLSSDRSSTSSAAPSPVDPAPSPTAAPSTPTAKARPTEAKQAVATPPAGGLPRRPAQQTGAGEYTVSFDHPTWGRSWLVTSDQDVTDNYDGAGKATLTVYDSSGEVRYRYANSGFSLFRLAGRKDSNPSSKEKSQVPSPIDAEGNIFINYNPGRYNGVIVLRPVAGGFEDFGTLPSPRDYNGRFYYAKATDPDHDGIYDIEESTNDCQPSCAEASITNTLHTWNGTDYS